MSKRTPADQTSARHVAVTVGFYVLLLAFLVFYLRDVDFSRLRATHVSLPLLVVASLLALVVRLMGAAIWAVMLANLGADVSGARGELLHVYAKSWLGRYIPGTAPWILGRIYFASRHGIAKSKLAISSLLEGALQIVVTMVLALMLLAFDRRLDVISTPAKLAMVLVGVAGIACLVPSIFNRLFVWLCRVLRRQRLSDKDLATSRTVVQGAALYAVFAVLNGISLFLVAKAVHPALAYGDLSFVVGVSSLAASVSMLAVFAPGGLGVREGIQLVLLSLIMPTEIALAIAVFTRLWSVAIDFLFFIVSIPLSRSSRSRPVGTAE
jgi:uncharacterized membrane protein YbhN (UPF0104 family)